MKRILKFIWKKLIVLLIFILMLIGIGVAQEVGRFISTKLFSN